MKSAFLCEESTSSFFVQMLIRLSTLIVYLIDLVVERVMLMFDSF